MLNSASKTEKFFYRDEDSTYPFWRLISAEENELMTNVKSKEARKYIFNCLDDIIQVNVQTDIESSQLSAEKVDRREFIDLLKRMLMIDQENRIQPAQALRHPFVTLSHLVDYAHCNNVKASVQMMEVCRRDHAVHNVQQTAITNFGPTTTDNMTFTINNQVQRLVRERNPTTYDNVYQFYGTPRNVVRGYTNTRAAEVLPPQLSFICPYNPMPSPTTSMGKHVVVGSGMQPSLQVPTQQYVPVPVSMTLEPNGQRMLLTNAVQSTVAWPQGGTRQVAIVPSWGQHAAAPHSLIVDSAQFYNVEEIYGKQPLSIHKYEKKESPVQHLNVPRHEKKETNQLSPVKKRVKENTPPHNHHHHMQPHQSRYNNNNNRSSSHHHHVSPQQQAQQQPPQPNSQYWNNNGHYDNGHKQRQQSSSQNYHHQIVNSTITINDTPSPILISDSEDENEHQKNSTSNTKSQQHQQNQQQQQQQNRKNVISCVTVGDSDGEEALTTATKNSSNSSSSKQQQHHSNVKYEQQQSQKKRFLVMSQNDSVQLGQSSGPLKQEPTEFSTSSTTTLNHQVDYPSYDHQKRSSWVSTSTMGQPPAAHSHNNHHVKRDSSSSNSGMIPPVAHAKIDIPSVSSSSTSLTPIYHHHHSHNHKPQTQNTTPLGISPISTTAAYLQPQQADIYAQTDLYRRPTVFVSQASYAYNTAINTRVVPPPAHNGNSRQVRK
jgi:homeodomain interacting protein kinase